MPYVEPLQPRTLGGRPTVVPVDTSAVLLDTSAVLLAAPGRGPGPDVLADALVCVQGLADLLRG